jgi:hypothetical protein
MGLVPRWGLVLYAMPAMRQAVIKKSGVINLSLYPPALQQRAQRCGQLDVVNTGQAKIKGSA